MQLMINGSKYSKRVGIKEDTVSKSTFLQDVELFYVLLNSQSNIQKSRCQNSILNLLTSSLIFL
jgi:hypothetical protein